MVATLGNRDSQRRAGVGGVLCSDEGEMNLEQEEIIRKLFHDRPSSGRHAFRLTMLRFDLRAIERTAYRDVTLGQAWDAMVSYIEEAERDK